MTTQNVPVTTTFLYFYNFVDTSTHLSGSGYLAAPGAAQHPLLHTGNNKESAKLALP